MKLVELTTEHPLMPAAYRLIRAVYSLSYDAHVTSVPRTVIALVDRQDKIHAAAGFRDSSEPYFSEYYLDAPVDAVIGRVTRTRIDRDKIVEVSSLASRTPAISVRFTRELVLYGEELGYDWAFFTATSRLEKLLRRMRLPLISLGAASASRVPTPEIWGTYYETDPRVLAFGREQLTPFLMKTAARGAVHEVRPHG
ncbi:MAG: thermostable hemolysin [Rhodomicrobium sp.]